MIATCEKRVALMTRSPLSRRIVRTIEAPGGVGGRGHLGIFGWVVLLWLLGGYVPPGTPNWHPVL